MDGSVTPSAVADIRASFLRLIADLAHGPLSALMLVLTVLTGVVDAVSILSLGRVFVASMTGNVGYTLAGASGFLLSASLSALAGFLVGAALAGWLVEPRGRSALLLPRGLSSRTHATAASLRGRQGDRLPEPLQARYPGPPL